MAKIPVFLSKTKALPGWPLIPDTMSETPASTVTDLSRLPMPTRQTLARRENLVLQVFRFVSFDLRILCMVAKGHH